MRPVDFMRSEEHTQQQDGKAQHRTVWNICGDRRLSFIVSSWGGANKAFPSKQEKHWRHMLNCVVGAM